MRSNDDLYTKREAVLASIGVGEKTPKGLVVLSDASEVATATGTTVAVEKRTEGEVADEVTEANVEAVFRCDGTESDLETADAPSVVCFWDSGEDAASAGDAVDCDGGFPCSDGVADGEEGVSADGKDCAGGIDGERVASGDRVVVSGQYVEYEVRISIVTCLVQRCLGGQSMTV